VIGVRFLSIIYPSKHIHVIKSNVYKRMKCHGRGLDPGGRDDAAGAEDGEITRVPGWGAAVGKG
jgi:hypothetical protein